MSAKGVWAGALLAGVAFLASARETESAQAQKGGEAARGRQQRKLEKLASLPRLVVLRDGRPWRAWVIEDLLPPGEVFQEDAERAVQGLPLIEFLTSAGVVKAARVAVQGRGMRPQEFEWTALQDSAQRPSLVLTSRHTLGLLGPGGRTSKPRLWVRDVWGIDLRQAVLHGETKSTQAPPASTAQAPASRGQAAASGAPRPDAQSPVAASLGRGRRPQAEAPTEIQVIDAQGAQRPLSLDAVRGAATMTRRWNGRNTPVTPFAALLALAGIPLAAKMRVSSQNDEVVLGPGSDLPGPEDFGVVFNRRGFPVLVPLVALRQPLSAAPAAALSSEAAPVGTPAPAPDATPGAPRRLADLKRFIRIEVLP